MTFRDSMWERVKEYCEQPLTGDDAPLPDKPEDVVVINVYGEEDPYPDAMWERVKEYCKHLTGDDALLPVGRYACAMALHERSLPVLRD